MFLYYMFNKPSGCITARRDARHKTVMDYFPEELCDKIFPVGRLDKDTEGLLLFTDDGQFNFNLLSPKFGKTKTYFFYAKGVPDEEKLSEIQNGISIYKDSDFVTSPAKVEITERKTLVEIKEFLDEENKNLANKKGELPVVGGYITITEGKKHQVKRMIRYTGPKVVYLKRVDISGVSLDETLKKGEYRPLRESELEILRK